MGCCCALMFLSSIIFIIVFLLQENPKRLKHMHLLLALHREVALKHIQHGAQQEQAFV